MHLNASFKPLCVKVKTVSSVEVRMKKVGRQEGSHKKCIIHVCVGQPPANGFKPNLAGVFVSTTLSSLLLEWFRCSDVLKFPCCHREARPSLTLCFFATAHTGVYPTAIITILSPTVNRARCLQIKWGRITMSRRKTDESQSLGYT